MSHQQPSFNSRNRHTHGRPVPRGSVLEQTAAPILERFTYDAYGKQRPAEGEPPAADAGEIGEGFNQMFQGGRVDPDSGMMDFRHRDMHPGMARWMDHEPLAYVDGLNAYLACGDNPINRIEPVEASPDQGASSPA